ncbi:hypothetical protein HHI36_015418 [Cryptolaemus montrouzieri]|uniref:Uncharacterized protein n=1 Tax=Cryptolaemus montrouzieri TaxID=559131 RepID=A0ABD2N5M0_9CUCU
MIKVEPPKKNNSIPQCANCQQLGHTKNIWNRESRCVKCAGKHNTDECEKQHAHCAMKRTPNQLHRVSGSIRPILFISEIIELALCSIVLVGSLGIGYISSKFSGCVA